ncbi:hypothetical protein EZJ58_3384 [Sodalis ligni]|uniref:Uncharacterized protein n=1 Tax=Sodalis ligni TaxID=2697027 RepID=A0A4R1NLV6_9GAMM|nr:hypothetical protein EZJ58_3384 [Sodalis ligni]
MSSHSEARFARISSYYYYRSNHVPCKYPKDAMHEPSLKFVASHPGYESRRAFFHGSRRIKLYVIIATLTERYGRASTALIGRCPTHS